MKSRTIVLALTLCHVFSAPRGTAGAEVPDRELRAAAERILSDPAFRNFDRFPTGSTTAPQPTPASRESAESTPEGPTDAGTSSEDSSANPRPATWWERLRDSRKRKESQSAPPNASPGTTPPAERSGEPGSSTPPPPSREQPATVPPQRAASEKAPSRRGHDGIARPVRFAPKSPTPRPSEDNANPGWKIGDGWLAAFGGLLGQLLHLVAYAALAAVCVLILVLAARALAENWPSRKHRVGPAMVPVSPLAHDRSPGETDADHFLQAALQWAAHGDYRLALGQLVLGAMSTIERRNWIRYRRGLTLNDYLRSVRSRPEQRDGLRAVIDRYLPVEFGRRPATEDSFTAALEGYRQGFGEQSEVRNAKSEGSSKSEAPNVSDG